MFLSCLNSFKERNLDMKIKDVEWNKPSQDRNYYLDLEYQGRIWVDKETGVNYLFYASDYAGGLTVLLDKEGKPVITPIEKY